MEKIPFTSYDFWAYLSAGVMLLFALDQAAATHLLAQGTWTVAQIVLAVITAYVVGQLVASTSSWLFERVLVGRLLGYPRKTLFGNPKYLPKLARFFPGYFIPLPEETQKAILVKALKHGVADSGEALFWPAHAYGRATPALATRLDNFLNQYGFCRNMALVALIDSAILYWSYMQPQGPQEHLLWARISLFIGFGMTLRYLKFFRLYAVELFTSWAYAKEKEPEAKP